MLTHVYTPYIFLCSVCKCDTWSTNETAALLIIHVYGAGELFNVFVLT